MYPYNGDEEGRLGNRGSYHLLDTTRKERIVIVVGLVFVFVCLLSVALTIGRP